MVVMCFECPVIHVEVRGKFPGSFGQNPNGAPFGYQFSTACKCYKLVLCSFLFIMLHELLCSCSFEWNMVRWLHMIDEVFSSYQPCQVSVWNRRFEG